MGDWRAAAQEAEEDAIPPDQAEEDATPPELRLRTIPLLWRCAVLGACSLSPPRGLQRHSDGTGCFSDSAASAPVADIRLGDQASRHARNSPTDSFQLSMVRFHP